MENESLSEFLARGGAEEIKKGGGTRRFFRAPFRGVPAVFCFYDDEKEENRYYAGIAEFLKKIGVPAPEILRDDPAKNLIVMEDLGAADLRSLVRENSPERSRAYRSALEGAARLHRFAPEDLRAGTPIMRDGFSRAYYKWERDYFLKNALDDGLRIPLSARERESLEAELSALADFLLALPPQLVHRDFQSENILWKDGAARFIDFQGMRVGTGWYDAASLIFDPYVEIPETERRALFAFYCGETGVPADAAAEKNLRLAAAQRLMQALGAYFFLSEKKGKPHFRAHALPALENLVAVSAGTLPRLHALAEKMLARERAFRKPSEFSTFNRKKKS